MTALPALFTTAELESACGGGVRLLGLAKAKTTADPVYTAFVAQVRTACEGDIYSKVGTSLDVNSAITQGDTFLGQVAIDIGVYYAHRRGAGGNEMPQWVSDGYNRAQAILDEYRSGDRRPPLVEEAPQSAPSHQVDMSDSGHGWTRSTWGGYC